MLPIFVREAARHRWHRLLTVTQYRYRTPKRTGKWYDSLLKAQRCANAIGAGFLDTAGHFVAYRETVLELREKT